MKETSSAISTRPRKDQYLPSGEVSGGNGNPDGNSRVSVQTASALTAGTLPVSTHHKLSGERRIDEPEEKRVDLPKKEEGAVQEVKKSGGKMVQGMVWALSSTLGVGIASYTQVIPEPAKLLLFGTALVGGAFWNRRQRAAGSA